MNWNGPSFHKKETAAWSNGLNDNISFHTVSVLSADTDSGWCNFQPSRMLCFHPGLAEIGGFAEALMPYGQMHESSPEEGFKGVKWDRLYLPEMGLWGYA